MLRKIGRLFVIKTRLEAYLVTYAIAVGAIERGIHYLQQYPGNAGWLLAAACLACRSSPAPSCSTAFARPRKPTRDD